LKILKSLIEARKNASDLEETIAHGAVMGLCAVIEFVLEKEPSLL